MEKLYWKGRKIQNAVLFKIKAFFHKRRDELESKKMICYLKKCSERSYKGLYKKYLHYCTDFVFGTNISFRKVRWYISLWFTKMNNKNKCVSCRG